MPCIPFPQLFSPEANPLGQSLSDLFPPSLSILKPSIQTPSNSMTWRMDGSAWHSTQLLYLCFCIWSRYYLTCECSPQWCVFLCVFYADFCSTLAVIYCVFGFAQARRHTTPHQTHTATPKDHAPQTASGRMVWRTFNFRWPFGEHVFLFHLLTVRTQLCAAKVCL